MWCGLHCQFHSHSPKHSTRSPIWRACVDVRSIVFTHFLRELHHLGSVAAWWQEHQTDTWSKTTCSASGILVIYLLDRRLVHLSLNELFQLEPISNKEHQDLTRLWRNRRPEEYAQ